jgi:creatinine amidohydrolase
VVAVARSYLLGELTWEEAGEAIRSADFIVLPTGSMEQHGLHLPLLTDTIRAENLARLVAERAWAEGLRVYVLPTLPYGVSEHHMRFPGTVSIDPETYVAFVESVGRSLARHGARRLVLMNFHGGNLAPLQVASANIRSRYGLRTYIVVWTEFARRFVEEELRPDPTWGHACEYETSMVMLFRPDLVRVDRIRRPSLANYRVTVEGASPRAFNYFDEISDTGGLGDPTRASAEKARVIVEKTTELIVRALKEILAAESRLYPGRG